MPKEKPQKTRSDYIESGIRMYRAMLQYRDYDDSELRGMAEDYADKQLAARQKRLEQKLLKVKFSREELQQEDSDWREQRVAAYLQEFSWNDANDYASLEALVSLEMQIRTCTRALEDPNTDPGLLKDLRNSLAILTREHRQLQKDLAIDRDTREKERSQRNVVDDWDRIKQEAREKLATLIAEFKANADKAENEGELRDRMKYHFAIPFEAVDDVLTNHRRVLGMPTELQKS